jgi:hypothetical protein
MPLDPDFSPADDVVKALVIAGLADIVVEGGATMAALESGAVELRLATGEIFHLGEATVTRIA